jgi:5-formyltetrahydrofolate cyclo-ligase
VSHIASEKSLSEQRKALRKQLREKRLALSSQQQARAAAAVYDRLVRSTLFSKASHIAFYLPANGELDTRPILQHALASGKHCYLPVLSPLHPGKMYFVRVRAGQPLTSNRWGIPEPALRASDIVRPLALDLVLMPLLGFDDEGNRLGMGKGFYDRAFAFRIGHGGQGNLHRHSPLLLGLAHACQKVKRVPAQSWDVPVDGVITDAGSYRPGRC